MKVYFCGVSESYFAILTPWNLSNYCVFVFGIVFDQTFLAQVQYCSLLLDCWVSKSIQLEKSKR